MSEEIQKLRLRLRQQQTNKEVWAQRAQVTLGFLFVTTVMAFTLVGWLNQ